MNNDHEQRIAELEIKLGHCEHFIEELNRAVFRQQQKIDLQQEQLREIYRLVRSESTIEGEATAQEIPPHY